jgi:hypothetical protein
MQTLEESCNNDNTTIKEDGKYKRYNLAKNVICLHRHNIYSILSKQHAITTYLLPYNKIISQNT